MLLASRNNRAPSVHIRDASSDITVDHLQSYNAPQQHFAINGGGRGFAFFNNTIKRNPNEPSRLTAGRGGAIIFFGVSGDIVLEKNDIEDISDDGINIVGATLEVSEINMSTRQIILNKNDFNTAGERLSLQTGNVLAFLSPTYSPIGFLRVESVSDQQTNGQLSGRIATLGSSSEKYLQQLLSRLRPGTRFYNLSVSSSRALIRQNFIANGIARGIIVQSPNALVADNQIVNTAMGFQARNSYGAFFEGPAGNIRVNGNYVFHTVKTSASDGAGLAVFAEGQSIPLIPGVVFHANLIEQSAGKGISMQNSDLSRIFANTNADTNRLSPSDGSIDISSSCRVLIGKNVRTPRDKVPGAKISPFGKCQIKAQKDY